MPRVAFITVAGFLALAIIGCASQPISKPVRTSLANGQSHFRPIGLAIDPRGGILVTDSFHNRVLWMSGTGRILASWGNRGRALGQFRRPLGLAVDSLRDTSGRRTFSTVGCSA